MEGRYSYYAFISYNHADSRVAQWLHRRLEGFRLPSEVSNDLGDGGRFLRPVFRDIDELSSGVLSEELQRKLAASRYLVVICSSNSAASRWVDREVRTFIDSGRADHIIPLMLEDGPQALPPSLREYTAGHPERELLGISMPAYGRERALAKVISRMLDVDFNTIWGRHQRQRRRLRAALGAVAAVFLALCLTLYEGWVDLQSEKSFAELSSVMRDVCTGNLLPAYGRTLEQIHSRFGRKEASRLKDRIESYMDDDRSLFPAYTIFRLDNDGGKAMRQSVSLSDDAAYVAWIDGDHIGLIRTSDGSAVHAAVPSHPDARPDSAPDWGGELQLHALDFLPGTHDLVILSSDGISVYDCETGAVKADRPCDHGFSVKITQHTDILNYHPCLAVDPDGELVATSVDDGGSRVRIWNAADLSPVRECVLPDGLQMEFIRRGDGRCLAVYERERSSRGIHLIDLEDGSLSSVEVPFSREFFVTVSGAIVRHEPGKPWLYGDEQVMIDTPVLAGHSDTVFGKHSGYDGILGHDGKSRTQDWWLFYEWLYGNDEEGNICQVLLRENTMLHANPEVTAVVADNVQTVTVMLPGRKR